MCMYCMSVCLSVQMVENLCSHKMSAQLYSQLKVVCESHVSSCVHQFLSYPLLIIKIIISNTERLIMPQVTRVGGMA